ncbi:MAG: hypothetical protein MR991_03540 [Clostridiales bacterium]|nr:hypothetical protein [Clostridiales bacterium]MDD7035584.1 hypothetical protein [Bacillota bacterium]MDY2919831.1 hypothetical protein [Lentihominibacter sp.]
MEKQEIKFTKKRIVLGIVVFMLAAGLIFVYMNKVFSMGDDDANRQTFKAMYSEAEDTIDVVYFGTSASNRYFINPMAYEESGMTCFTMATMGMPMFFIPYLAEEIDKTQDPQMYIIEIRWLLKEREQVTDAHIRRVTDNMKMSFTKLAAVNKAFEFMDGSKGMLGDISDKKIDYMIPFIKYHGRLAQNDMAPGDFALTSTKNETKGYVLSESTTKQVNQFYSRLSDERGEMSEEAEVTLEEVLDFCDDCDKEVLFVLSPYSVKTNQMPVFNTAMDMIEDRGYTVINFNTPQMYEELEIDWDKDFYNSKHVNYLGAEKYTRWLTNYLEENYDLADHRDEKGYESWDEAYEVYRDYVKDGIKTIGHKDKIGGKVTIIK